MKLWKIYTVIVEGGDDLSGRYLISFKVIEQSREKALVFLTSTDEYRLINNGIVDEIIEVGVSWRSFFRSESAKIIHQTGRAFFES